jgi:hypothetical protein
MARRREPPIGGSALTAIDGSNWASPKTFRDPDFEYGPRPADREGLASHVHYVDGWEKNGAHLPHPGVVLIKESPSGRRPAGPA